MARISDLSVSSPPPSIPTMSSWWVVACPICNKHYFKQNCGLCNNWLAHHLQTSTDDGHPGEDTHIVHWYLQQHGPRKAQVRSCMSGATGLHSSSHTKRMLQLQAPKAAKRNRVCRLRRGSMGKTSSGWELQSAELMLNTLKTRSSC